MGSRALHSTIQRDLGIAVVGWTFPNIEEPPLHLRNLKLENIFYIDISKDGSGDDINIRLADFSESTEFVD